MSRNKVPFIRSSEKIKNGSRTEIDLTSRAGIPKVEPNNSPTAPRCAADFSPKPHNRSEKANNREIRGGGILTATSQERARRPFVHVYSSGWSTEKVLIPRCPLCPRPFPSLFPLPFYSPLLSCAGREVVRAQACMQAGRRARSRTASQPARALCCSISNFLL